MILELGCVVKHVHSCRINDYERLIIHVYNNRVQMLETVTTEVDNMQRVTFLQSIKVNAHWVQIGLQKEGNHRISIFT